MSFARLLISILVPSFQNCLRPWTSMRGKICFAFKLESILREGYIFMKIFGQVCIQDKCQDRDFQTPACYPEEIDRVSLRNVNCLVFIYFLCIYTYIQPISNTNIVDKFYHDHEF
jgi:hypothetical protein